MMESGSIIRRIKDMLGPGENLDEFLFKCRQNPKDFMNRLIGLSVPVKEFHVVWFNKFLHNKRNVVIAFRGSGKTEILGVIFFLYISLFMRNKSMILVSKTLPMSKEILKRVRVYIEGNEILQSLKPLHHELTWTKTEINTKTNCTLFCKPYSDNIRTWHVDYAFLDEAGFYEDKDIFYYIIIPILQFKDANLMVASTPKSLIDLPHELAKNKKYWSAIYPVVNDKNQPLWPEKYPLQKIASIKDDTLSSAKFAREYLCKVVTDEASLLSAADLEQACDDNIRMVETEHNPGFYFLGADFALSPKGNYSFFIVVKKVDNKLVIKYAERHRGTDYKFQEERIRELCKKFPITKGFLDKGSFGRIIVQDLESEFSTLEGFDFQSKKDEIIENMVAKFKQEYPVVIIPTDPEEPYTRKMSDVIIKELSEIQPQETKTGKTIYGKVGAYNDAAMALALALHASDQVVEVDSLLEVW